MLKQTWLAKLQKLHPSVSKAKGAGNARFAPHKPLLLLCLIDLSSDWLCKTTPHSKQLHFMGAVSFDIETAEF